jgi:hypothetical protein
LTGGRVDFYFAFLKPGLLEFVFLTFNISRIPPILIRIGTLFSDRKYVPPIFSGYILRYHRQNASTGDIFVLIDLNQPFSIEVVIIDFTGETGLFVRCKVGKQEEPGLLYSWLFDMILNWTGLAGLSGVI